MVKKKRVSAGANPHNTTHKKLVDSDIKVDQKKSEDDKVSTEVADISPEEEAVEVNAMLNDDGQNSNRVFSHFAEMPDWTKKTFTYMKVLRTLI